MASIKNACHSLNIYHVIQSRKEVKYEEVNCSSNTLSSKKVIKLKGVYASIE